MRYFDCGDDVFFLQLSEPSLRSEIRTKVRFRTTLQWLVLEGFPFSSLLHPEFPFPECVQTTNNNIVQLLKHRNIICESAFLLCYPDQ